MDTSFKRSATFYDEESKNYSRRRYPKVATNYIQFFFTRRRELVLDLLSRAVERTATPRSLVEIGCADGILLRSVQERIPKAFDQLVGIDIAEGMIAVAKDITNDPAISYEVRKDFISGRKFTVAMEIGVGELTLRTEAEAEWAATQLTPGGYFLCGFAGRDSIVARLDKAAARRGHLNTYATYEVALRKYFSIVDVRAYGFYVPFIWRVPFLARIVQPVAEVFGAAFPDLCHEKVYLLQKLPKAQEFEENPRPAR